MTWTNPTANPHITSGFSGRRVHPLTGRVTAHTGTDFRAPTGTPILAASAGRVQGRGYDRPRAQGGTGAGNWIRLDHGNGVTTRYYHLSKIQVSPGQAVTAGQRIGLSGSTGDSSAAHLHFEIRINGTPTNPVPYLSARSAVTVSNPGVGLPDAPDAPDLALPDALEQIMPSLDQEDLDNVARRVAQLLDERRPTFRTDVADAVWVHPQWAVPGTERADSPRVWLEQARVAAVQAVHAAVKGGNPAAIAAALTPAIVAALPTAGAGGLTRGDVEQAVRNVFASIPD